ncbi:MAG: hypothetical protein WAQ25_04890 [Candidatus Saccharimonas sp.]
MKKIRIVNVAALFAVATVGVAAIGFGPKAYAATQTCTWTGAGSDTKFSTVANWSNCGGGAPLAGDIIRFDTLQSTKVTMVNDLNVELGGLVSVAQTRDNTKLGGYAVDTLSFAPGAVTSVEKASVCIYSLPVIEAGAISGNNLTLSNDLFNFYNGSTVFTLSGTTLVTSSESSRYVAGAAGSSAGSFTFVSPGSNTTATSCQAGGFGAGVPGSSVQGITYSSITLQNGTSMTLAEDYSKPMYVGGGTGTESPAIYFPGLVSPTGTPQATTRAWSSPLTLMNNMLVSVNELTTVNFTGTVDGAGKTVTKTAYSTGVFNFNPTANNSNTGAGTQTNPVITTLLDGVTADYVRVVGNETAILNGERASVQVLRDGILKGTGKASAIGVSAGGIIAPGGSPGCLTAGTLYLSGEYQFELGGTDACTGYDQIKVTGAGTSVTLNTDTSVLTTSRFKDYTPKQNQVFVIIDNQSANDVSGTFKGLAEGAVFEQNGIVFKISYKGGDGNDVTLTVQNVPKAPNTGFELVKANPALVAGATIGSAIVLFGLARFATKR